MPSSLHPSLPPSLRKTLTKKGFAELTAVQSAVLDPAHEGRDLRVSSQTGSGKTVAIGVAIFSIVSAERAEGQKGPRCILITPTRELAAQVRSELEWLYESDKLKVISVTGGTSVRDELRALRSGADVIVGTPGRLVDHLDRGAIDASSVGAIIFDEADQMLDLGFRDSLEAIMKKMPEGIRVHMMSATFSREVLSLARRYQRDAVHVEGTRLGDANVDICHSACLVKGNEREDALVNVLLTDPSAQTLIFVRTRLETTTLANHLLQHGFSAATLSGDMEQQERTRTLDAFRAGTITILVATDVAARGIDVQNILRVVHIEPPGNSDTYTHRSGRTGRAGRKGESILLITPSERERTLRILSRAKVNFSFGTIPTEKDIRALADRRLVDEIKANAADESVQEAFAPIASQLLEGAETQAVVAALLKKLHHAGPCEARNVTPLSGPSMPARKRPGYESRPMHGGRPFESRDLAPPRARGYAERAPRDFGAPRSNGEGRDFGAPRGESRDVGAPGAARFESPDFGAPPKAMRDEPRGDRKPAMRDEPRDADRDDRRPPRASHAMNDMAPNFVSFRVNWGARQGADARRLLAMVCRRGNIRGADVGTIDIGESESTFGVNSAAADSFSYQAARPDPRDPYIRIAPARGGRRTEEAPTFPKKRPRPAQGTRPPTRR